MSTPMKIFPVLKELTTMPKAQPRKDRPDRVQDILPESLTSEKSIRNLAIAELKTAQEKAGKERIAKKNMLCEWQRNPTSGGKWQLKEKERRNGYLAKTVFAQVALDHSKRTKEMA